MSKPKLMIDPTQPPWKKTIVLASIFSVLQYDESPILEMFTILLAILTIFMVNRWQYS